MPVRPEVRDTQRTLAALDGAHARAVASLHQAVARRAEALAEHDRHVAAAQAAADAAVAEMAGQISAELTAQLLGMDLASVRRCAKVQGRPAKSVGGANSDRRATAGGGPGPRRGPGRRPRPDRGLAPPRRSRGHRARPRRPSRAAKRHGFSGGFAGKRW